VTANCKPQTAGQLVLPAAWRRFALRLIVAGGMLMIVCGLTAQTAAPRPMKIPAGDQPSPEIRVPGPGQVAPGSAPKSSPQNPSGSGVTWNSRSIAADVLGTHDLTPRGKSPVKGRLNSACLYCHAPHSAMGNSKTPLWNQQLTHATYNRYASSSYHEQFVQPQVGSDSRLCLSCHDGTVAPGQTVAYGKLHMTGKMSAASILGTDLRGSHPFSLKRPLTDAPELNAQLSSHSPKTADPAVQLINGTVECTSCHNPHVESTDKVVPDFLVRDSSGGRLCLACHDPERQVNGRVNHLSGWPTSIHAKAVNTTKNQPDVGGYRTVAANACNACHVSHNSPGAARLLRGKDEQACVGCHAGGSNVSPALPDVFSEFAKIGHPFYTSAKSVHDGGEAVLLQNNRHATCADCHNAHATGSVTTFTTPPLLRASQKSVAGISAADGVSALNPAVNQYENCLRCHGTSAGKALDSKFGYHPIRAMAPGDPLNLVPQFSAAAASSHPVFHSRSSAYPQPSLRLQMMNLDGMTPGRSMATQIFCTDCHNSDDNREFGGKGASGPHGSKFSHLLERRYEFSQAPHPGQPILNLFPHPDLTVNGPYGLCAKCHDLRQVLANTSYKDHARHINDGFSCSVCHTPHGNGGQAAGISGERLVNFDVNVVESNAGAPIGYSRATNSCSLICHQHPHQALPQGGAKK
jgi:predicted CXXCH cytochrome family protein